LGTSPHEWIITTIKTVAGLSAASRA
jgi:hypothetical protein